MKANLEYWVPEISQHEREYERIVRHAEFMGMGVPISRALVVGERVAASETGNSPYHYKFLWIIDPKVTRTLGAACSYPYGLRPAMSDLFRLHKSEIYYESVDNNMGSMRAELKKNPKVEFCQGVFLPGVVPVGAKMCGPSMEKGRWYGRQGSIDAQNTITSLGAAKQFL